ncbi:unnamed protein product [Cochlearia groenlandica]
MIAFPQLIAPCIRNFVAVMVAAKELGIEMTLHVFEEITRVNQNHSFAGTWSICWKPGFRLTSDTSVKFPNWWEKLFFVKMNTASVLTSIGCIKPSVRFVPIYPFPPEYNPLKEAFKRREEVPWVEKIDAMLTLADFPGVFDDEVEAEFLAEEEEEVREADLEAGSPSLQTMPEGSPPATNSPPLRAGSPPPLAVIPPLPVVPDEVKVGEDQAVGLGFEEADRSTSDVDPSEQAEDGPRHLLVEGDGFAHQRGEDNEHGFYFAYDGAETFLNHREASVGFQRAVYSAAYGEEAPTELVLADEIAQLARLE